VDRRADIWAFGVVLFEMLSGKQLFTGDTAAEIMASALKEAPNFDRLPASTPPVIRRLIERCLNKDPKQRLRDIGEARIVLNVSMEEPATAAITGPPRSRLGWLAWAVAGALALALIVAGVLLYRATRPAELKPLVRLDVDLGTGVSLDSTAGADTIISPDAHGLSTCRRENFLLAEWTRPKQSNWRVRTCDAISRPVLCVAVRRRSFRGR
jgi:serine/threonine-protein kinase